MTLRALATTVLIVVGITGRCQGNVILRDNGGFPDFALIDKITNVYIAGTNYAPGYFDFTFHYGNSYLYWENLFGSNAHLMWWNTQADALTALDAIKAEVSSFGDVSGTKRTEDVYLAYAYGSTPGLTTVDVVYGDNLGGTNYSEWWNPADTNPRFQFNRSGNFDINPFDVWVTTAWAVVPEPSTSALLLLFLGLAASRTQR